MTHYKVSVWHAGNSLMPEVFLIWLESRWRMDAVYIVGDGQDADSNGSGTKHQNLYCSIENHAYSNPSVRLKIGNKKN